MLSVPDSVPWFRMPINSPDTAAIAAAADWLQHENLIILPTETVYGVAAVASSSVAMNKLVTAKHRDPNKKISLLVSGMEALAHLDVPPLARRLAETFWPGPLTLVLETPEGTWEGYRVPHHPVALAVIRAMGAIRLAVTSANQSGEPPAQTAEAAWEALTSHVSLVLDAGPSSGGVASTVIRVDRHSWEILRPGALTEKQLRSLLS